MQTTITSQSFCDGEATRVRVRGFSSNGCYSTSDKTSQQVWCLALDSGYLRTFNTSTSCEGIFTDAMIPDSIFEWTCSFPTPEDNNLTQCIAGGYTAPSEGSLLVWHFPPPAATCPIASPSPTPASVDVYDTHTEYCAPGEPPGASYLQYACSPWGAELRNFSNSQCAGSFSSLANFSAGCAASADGGTSFLQCLAPPPSSSPTPTPSPTPSSSAFPHDHGPRGSGSSARSGTGSLEPLVGFGFAVLVLAALAAAYFFLRRYYFSLNNHQLLGGPSFLQKYRENGVLRGQ